MPSVIRPSYRGDMSSFPNKVHLAALSAAGAIIVIASFTAASRSSLLATFNEEAIASGLARRLLQNTFQIDQMPKPASYSKMLLGLEDEARMLAYTYKNIFRLGKHAGENQTDADDLHEARMLAYTYKNIFRLGKHAGENQTDADDLHNMHVTMTMTNKAADTGMANVTGENQTASDDVLLEVGNSSDSNETHGARPQADSVISHDDGTQPCTITDNCKADEKIGLIQESEQTPRPPFSSSPNSLTLAQAEPMSKNATDATVVVDPDVTRPAKYIEADEMLKPATYEKIFRVNDQPIGDSAEIGNATIPATLSSGNSSGLLAESKGQNESHITHQMNNNVTSESEKMLA